MSVKSIITYDNIMAVLVGAYTSAVIYQSLSKPQDLPFDQVRNVLGSAMLGVASSQIWPMMLLFHSFTTLKSNQ